MNFWSRSYLNSKTSIKNAWPRPSCTSPSIIREKMTRLPKQSITHLSQIKMAREHLLKRSQMIKKLKCPGVSTISQEHLESSTPSQTGKKCLRVSVKSKTLRFQPTSLSKVQTRSSFQLLFSYSTNANPRTLTSHCQSYFKMTGKVPLSNFRSLRIALRFNKKKIRPFNLAKSRIKFHLLMIFKRLRREVNQPNLLKFGSVLILLRDLSYSPSLLISLPRLKRCLKVL